jgi:4-hydroxy-4-methyl-2-oxoglutarate aldolase
MKTTAPILTWDQFESLRRLETCLVANAIDTFNIRLRNEGYADARIKCLFPRLAPILGHAVTLKIKCSSPPLAGHSYPDRTDWWNQILKIPAPRVVVIQDTDEHPGTGAFLGEVHSTILQALGCVGAITNGAVRDLSAVEANRFQFFAGSIAVSHAYSHIVAIGGEVEIGALKIKPGDLLHGDRHGILSIPGEIAADLPAVAGKILDQERKLIALCRAPDFSMEKLRAAINQT